VDRFIAFATLPTSGCRLAAPASLPWPAPCQAQSKQPLLGACPACQQAAGGSGGGGEGQFKATRSAAEMAMMQAEGYAEEGLAEHKVSGSWMRVLGCSDRPGSGCAARHACCLSWHSLYSCA
jgi:hypothetical protein